MSKRIRAGAAAVFVAFTLLLAACGGDSQDSALATQAVPATEPSEEELAIRAVAEDNQANLDLNDELASTELLDSRTGAISSLDDVITGDRAVMLWYFAPN